MDKKVSVESVVKDIRRRTRKKYSSEEKTHIVKLLHFLHTFQQKREMLLLLLIQINIK
jgi:hypothetical protein